jgi:hypothetical protein
MDLHAPAGPVRSFKDFLVHLGIVTLGILIALGLEQLVEAHHRAKIAAEAVAGFRHEIGDDMARVREVMAAMPHLRAQSQDAVAKLRAPAPPDAAGGTIEYPGINLEYVATSSWDTAIATQALNELAYDSVKRYAEAFAAIHLFFDQERIGVGIWQDLRRFGDDPAALSKEQRATLIEEFRRYESHTKTVEAVGKGTLEACERALQ